ncbi:MULTISPECIES: molybdopterin-containing oxidoreductase family protein [Sphingobium]|uniref:molybdopterin-containing oxidoreductase family protein n=1 Tax=Sphingobium sp. MI1205 TaxID=407020 RepID=UPI00076FE200|nr:molybdopterin-dependent oxidoreductase [Sphingobium sp. MI1205]AMK19940.1 nitrate reductase [Sphingobium sp. MI1205]
MTSREVPSFCRLCSGGCGVKVTIENDRVTRVRADPDHPLSHGYACFKGLQAPESHYGPARVLRPLARQADGRFSEIGSEIALDEIGARLKAIEEKYGAEAIGMYCGNGSMSGYITFAMQRAFMSAIGSRQRFTTFTIDQSAKFVSFERLGGWAGGTEQLETSDVVMMFGGNPLISHAALGVLCVDPVKRLKQAKARGMKLIVVDPRRTETAVHAEVFLQPFPGQDVPIAAAMLRMILAEGWHDADFCARFVGADRLDDLRQAVEPYTPEFAEKRAGLNPGDIARATRLFALESGRGVAIGSTGPNFSPFSNLAQHLIDCLNVVCGRFPRAGDKVVAVDVLDPPAAYIEEVVPAPRSWEAFPPSRIRGVGMIYGERLTGTLADEILTPGEGQIRALIVSGGNPANSVPDQERIIEALKSLELLVVIDPYPTVTSELADYILPTTLMFEHADMPLSVPGMSFWPVAFSQYTPALVPPPPGSDVVDDWYALWAIAQRMGKQVRFDDAVDLDMTVRPDAEDLIAIRARRSAVPLDEIKAHPGGKIFDLADIHVQPARAEATGRFDVMPADVADELRAATAYCPNGDFTHLIATRRMRDLYNSNGYHLRTTRARNPYNPVALHPDDMTSLGLAEGDEVEIQSEVATVRAVAKSDPTLKPGVITISHGWGGVPGRQGDPRAGGTSINPLISDHEHVEIVNAMPRMSAIPVNLKRVQNENSKTEERWFEPAAPTVGRMADTGP